MNLNVGLYFEIFSSNNPLFSRSCHDCLLRILFLQDWFPRIITLNILKRKLPWEPGVKDSNSNSPRKSGVSETGAFEMLPQVYINKEVLIFQFCGASLSYYGYLVTLTYIWILLQ